jgi:phage-related protein
VPGIARGRQNATWRIVCRTDPDVVVIAAVFEKKTQSTPKQEIENSKARLAAFDRVRNGGKR